MANPIIVCEKLSKSYPVPGGEELEILRDIDWEMETGSLVAICGQSGCGKSTFMNILGLLDRQTSGRLILDSTVFETERDNRKLASYRASKIGFIFQQHFLLPELSALQNVMVAELIRGRSKKEAKNAAVTILKRLFSESEVDSGIMDRLPEKMSGGQCQRVAIARALVGNPPIILADEPTGNLDETSAQQVFTMFLKLQKELGISTVIVTHNPAQAALADKMYQISGGNINLATTAHAK